MNEDTMVRGGTASTGGDRPQVTAPQRDPEELSDDEIGGLVRATADRWSMPPQALHTATWRDRVAAGGTRPGFARGIPGAVARAAVGAVAATIVVAFLAIALTGQGGRRTGGGGLPVTTPVGTNPAAAPQTSPARSSTAPFAPSASGLPAIAQYGAPLTGSVLVRGGTYRAVDMRTGELSPPLGQNYDDLLTQRSDGAYLCLCWIRSHPAVGEDRARLVRRTIDAGGRVRDETTVLELVGHSLTGMNTDRQGASIEASMAWSADRSTVFLAQSVRTPPLWSVSLDVIDVASGKVRQTVPVGSYSSGDAKASLFASVSLDVAPDGGHVVTTVHSSTEDGNALPRSYLLGTVRDGRVGPLEPFAAGAGGLGGGACENGFQGFAAADIFAAACGPDHAPFLRRIPLGGGVLSDVPLGDVQVGFRSPVEAGFPKLDTKTGTLYVWEPFGHRLTAIDVRGGAVRGSTTVPESQRAPGAGVDPVRSLAQAFGRWLAPSALAKIVLDPALAISPDGSRLYALGTAGADEGGGSTGVWVFDTASLALVAHWPPTADLISLAVSPDGTVVYAAGMAGFDPSGVNPSWEASVTAFDARDGSVRAVAGQLGGRNALVLADAVTP